MFFFFGTCLPNLFVIMTSFVLVMFAVIFKVYDTDSKGKVGFKDLLEVLRDLTGSFMSEKQREVSFYHHHHHPPNPTQKKRTYLVNFPAFAMYIMKQLLAIFY